MRMALGSAAGRRLCGALLGVLALGWAVVGASAQSAPNGGDASAVAAAGPGDADAWEMLPPDLDLPLFSDAELERLVAPIALFPDVLVAQILIAATYPLDVVRADRWVRTNAALEGEERFAALEAQGWDPSIMALTGFPVVLERMAGDLDWTEALGDALITQDEDLLDAVQRLRAMAQAAGFLASGDEITVSIEDDAILIDPTDPDVIFLPLYDPDLLFEAARAGAYAGAREAAGDGAGGPQVVVVEQAAPATIVVDNRGHSTAVLATPAPIAFATGVVVGSLWNTNRWYRSSWWGPTRVHHHHHIHWRGGGIYRPPVIIAPGLRPGHRPGLRPDDRWRPRPEDRTRRRDEIIRDRVSTGRPGGDGARLPGSAQPPRVPADRGDALRDRLGDRGRLPQTERDRLREAAADRVRSPGETSTRPVDAARPRPPLRDGALGGQRSVTEAARDRDRGRQSLDRPGPAGGASRDAARDRLQQGAEQRRAEPQRPQRPAAVPDRPQRPAATPQRPQRPAATPQRPQRPAAAPDRPQRPAAAPQRPQRPAAAPQRPQRPAATPQRREQTTRPARGGGLDVQRTRNVQQDRSRGQTSRPAVDRRPSR